MKLLKYLPAIFLLSSAIHAAPTASSTATVTNWPNSQILMPVQIAGHFHYYISNDTDGAKMYYMKMTLCPVDQMARCIVKQEQLGLSKGQHYTRDLDLDQTVVFRAVGDHSITATTEVTGAAISSSFDQKYLWVHY